jgi:hypothetical protein
MRSTRLIAQRNAPEEVNRMFLLTYLIVPIVTLVDPSVIAPVVLGAHGSETPQPATITYQGRLDLEGSAYNGSADLRFELRESA